MSNILPGHEPREKAERIVALKLITRISALAFRCLPLPGNHQEYVIKKDFAWEKWTCHKREASGPLCDGFRKNGRCCHTLAVEIMEEKKQSRQMNLF